MKIPNIRKFLRNTHSGISLFRKEFEGRLRDADRVIESVAFMQETVERAQEFMERKPKAKSISGAIISVKSVTRK